MAFADVIYTITDIRVAKLLASGSYHTTSFSLLLGSEMSFSFSADNDQIKSYGLLAALLSIITGVEGTLKQASIDRDGIYVLTGTDAESSGSTPNQQVTMDVLAGGAGLPYFGAVGNFAADDGGNALVGLRKCKLDTWPAWTVEQNRFRITDTPFKAIPIDTTTRKLVRIRPYETATSIPSDINSFFA